MTKNTLDINESTIKRFVASIRPEDLKIRKQLDYGYTYDGKTAILYAIRPVWNNPNEIQNIEFAKIRFYKSRKEWNLYWMRANGNWEIYEPFPKSSHLEKLIDVVKEDKHGCFFG
ncbi:DUF3024 domain-containing protein [Zhouia spongiae]|uniref:DUF3024 domain-containing protein n=1 Tax=Zhouia spongiae TaxID=2202721 RepID=A0ABY3YIV3_9FLAO|nr:DUF3024 domain-containing protein [Zhouia spongiae]UNY97759.1 DUF3024 domain-containing protein [Zhouia spongiae]